MNQFDLRPVPGGVEPSGGPLEALMVFREAERQAIQLVGFLSQADGGPLLIRDEVGSDEGTKESCSNRLATSSLRGANELS